MKKNEIAKIILGGLVLTGGIIVLTAMPGLAEAFRPFMNKKKVDNARFRRSFNSLVKSGLIGIGKDGDKTVVKLTKEGKNKVLKFKFQDLVIEKQKKWDKKWRMVIFDIPEKFKRGRTELAYKLRQMGFVALQRSVWICPYPCEDEIDFITELFEVRQYVRIVTAESIDLQQDLLKIFNLRH